MSKLSPVRERALRFSSKVLEHDPKYLGLELSKEGWVSLSRLLTAFAKKGLEVTSKEYKSFLEDNDRGLEISGDGNRVRYNPDLCVKTKRLSDYYEDYYSYWNESELLLQENFSYAFQKEEQLVAVVPTEYVEHWLKVNLVKLHEFEDKIYVVRNHLFQPGWRNSARYRN